MSVFSLITGFLLLLAGRRLFWVSVACVGFLVAYQAVLSGGVPGPPWLTWVLPLTIGLIGALVALLWQKVAVVLAGFLIGGLVVADMLPFLGGTVSPFLWVSLLAGGIIGALAMLVVFDWALIVLSSLAGAVVLVQTLGMGDAGSNLLFLVLAGLGIGVQSLMFLRTRKRSG